MKKEFKFTKREMKIITGDDETYQKEMVRIAIEALVGTAIAITGWVLVPTMIISGPSLIGGSMIFDSIRSFIRTKRGRKMYLEGQKDDDDDDFEEEYDEEEYEEEKTR